MVASWVDSAFSPDGNFVGSACSLPSAPRSLVLQPSAQRPCQCQALLSRDGHAMLALLMVDEVLTSIR